MLHVRFAMHGGICIKENWEKGENIERQDRTDKKNESNNRLTELTDLKTKQKLLNLLYVIVH